MKEIKPVNIAAVGRITKNIHTTLIIRLSHNIMYLVELDKMIVTLYTHGTAPDIMHQVVRNAHTNTVYKYGRCIGMIYSRNLVYMTILNEMTARRQRPAISTPHGQAATTHCVDITSNQTVIISTLHSNTIPRKITNRTVGKNAPFAAFDLQA